MKLLREQGQQLASAAHMIAEPLIAAEDGKHKRYQKVEHAKPCEKDVEEAQCKVDDGPDPEIIIPMCFLILHTAASLIKSSILLAGQVFAHLPQPMQRFLSMTAKQPFQTVIASRGHSWVQAPQETHLFLSARAYLLGAITCSLNSYCCVAD